MEKAAKNETVLLYVLHSLHLIAFSCVVLRCSADVLWHRSQQEKCWKVCSLFLSLMSSFVSVTASFHLWLQFLKVTRSEYVTQSLPGKDTQLFKAGHCKNKTFPSFCIGVLGCRKNLYLFIIFFFCLFVFFPLLMWNHWNLVPLAVTLCFTTELHCGGWSFCTLRSSRR